VVWCIAGPSGIEESEVKGLTEKQRRVFDFIRSHIVRSNRPPTIREIGSEFGMRSTGSVRDVLAALARKGFIAKDPGVSRGIRIKAGPGPVSGDIVELPVIDRVASGTAIDAYRDASETLKIDRSMVPEGDIFVVKVKDDSMAQAGIHDGDCAFVRRQPTCRPGRIVAALVGDEVVLREFTRKGSEIHLLPKNRRYKPTVVGLENFKSAILGVVVGVYRRF
jgi:repressor LexA